MMYSANLVAMALAPVVVLITYVYFNDYNNKEPRKLLLVCFLLGIISVVPAIAMSTLFEYLGLHLDPSSLRRTFLFAFITVAFSEELAKFIFLRRYAYRKKAFDEPYDGIMYAMMIGMGFAGIENFLYVASQGDLAASMQVAGLRALTAVPAHATFAILMGYYAGKAKFASKNKTGLLLFGLLAATVFHGAYDFFLMQDVVPGIVIGAFVSLAVAIWLSVKAIRIHQRFVMPKEEV